MGKMPLILLALAGLALASCSSGTTAISMVSSAGMWLTRPGAPDPVDPSLQQAEHESWCYETLGYVECYDAPQAGRGNGLVSVEPQNRYPLNPRAYQEAVFLSRADEKAMVKPVSVSTAVSASPAAAPASAHKPDPAAKAKK